ncbi:MAG: hypothetical protein IT376_20015 [Polyangiaceae bacterium]|nr:hypothetical protein [Polyangiaceae bacterium]
MYPSILLRPAPDWSTVELAQRCAEVLESEWFVAEMLGGSVPSISVRTPTDNGAGPGFARFHGPYPEYEGDDDADGYSHILELRRQCEDVESLAGEWFRELKVLGIPMRLEDCGGIVLEMFEP